MDTDNGNHNTMNKSQLKRLFGTFEKDSGEIYLDNGVLPGEHADDYEFKYARDPAFEGAGPSARIWQVYNDEADAFDSDMVGGWKDMLDVFLVFVGLFSAVVTAFLVQSSVALKDPVKINNYLISELIAVQRASAKGESVDNVPSSPYGPDDHTGEASDFWDNGLWIMSLTLALSSALIAMLIKQWIQYYLAAVSGSPQDRAFVRQHRYSRLKKWRVPLIIHLLPALLHLALFLFLAGLAVYFNPLHAGLSRMVACITAAALLAYLSVVILPIIYPGDCPYKTVLSEMLLSAFRGGARSDSTSPTRTTLSGDSDSEGCEGGLEGQPGQAPQSGEEEVQGGAAPSESLFRTHESMEVRCNSSSLLVESFQWLLLNSTNPSILKVLPEAFAGIPTGLSKAEGLNAENHATYHIPIRSLDPGDRIVIDVQNILDGARVAAPNALFVAQAVEILQSFTRIWHSVTHGNSATHNDNRDSAESRQKNKPKRSPFDQFANLISDTSVRLPPALWFGLGDAAKRAMTAPPPTGRQNGNLLLVSSLLSDNVVKMFIEVVGPLYKHKPMQDGQAARSFLENYRANSHSVTGPTSAAFQDVANDMRPSFHCILFENIWYKRMHRKTRTTRGPKEIASQEYDGCEWPMLFEHFGVPYPRHTFGWEGMQYQGYTGQAEYLESSGNPERASSSVLHTPSRTSNTPLCDSDSSSQLQDDDDSDTRNQGIPVTIKPQTTGGENLDIEAQRPLGSSSRHPLSRQQPVGSAHRIRT